MWTKSKNSGNPRTKPYDWAFDAFGKRKKNHNGGRSNYKKNIRLNSGPEKRQSIPY